MIKESVGFRQKKSCSIYIGMDRSAIRTEAMYNVSAGVNKKQMKNVHETPTVLT